MEKYFTDDFSAPAILLNIIVKGLGEFFIEETQLYQAEELDDDLME